MSDLPDSQGLKLKDAAKFFPCSVTTMRKFMDTGLVPYYRITPGGPRAATVGNLKAARERINEVTPEPERIGFADAVKQIEAGL